MGAYSCRRATFKGGKQQAGGGGSRYSTGCPRPAGGAMPPLHRATMQKSTDVDLEASRRQHMTPPPPPRHNRSSVLSLQGSQRLQSGPQHRDRQETQAIERLGLGGAVQMGPTFLSFR